MQGTVGSVREDIGELCDGAMVGSVRGAIGETVDDGVARSGSGWLGMSWAREKASRERKKGSRLGCWGWLGMAGGCWGWLGTVRRREQTVRKREQRLERDEKRILENGLRKNFP